MIRLCACVVLLAGCTNDGVQHASFDTLADARGTTTMHWLPEDLPSDATDFEVTTDKAKRSAAFEYDAPANAIPSSCVAQAPQQWNCGTVTDRYALSFDADAGRWSGRIDY